MSSAAPVCDELAHLLERHKCVHAQRIPESMLSSRVPVIVGIDEAGRGCVLGSLVYGVVVWATDKGAVADQVKALGLNDSKKLTALARERALAQLERADWLATMSLEMPADALSAAMGSGINLNVLSHAMICALVSQAASLFCVVGVFCDTVGPEQTLAGKIRSVCPAGAEVTVSAKADSLFPIVSAASIVAKVERDRLLSLLHAKCAEEGVQSPGSGYSSDAVTVAWLEAVVAGRQTATFRPWLRTKWATYERIAGAAKRK